VKYWWKIISSEDVHQNSNWMCMLAPIIGPKSLMDIVLPGSHDSCTYNLSATSSYAPDAPPSLIDSSVRGLAKGVVALGSKTQNKTTRQQLDEGIRYFDIRVGYLFNKFFIVHGLCGPEIDKVLEDVVDFLKNCPKEIIILDLNHFYDLNMESHAILANRIVEILGHLLCPSFRGPAVTFNELWENSENIILIYHDPYITEQNPKFWPPHKITSPWPNTTSVSDLFKFLPQTIQNRPKDALHVTQGILTPTINTIILGILPTFPSSIKQFVKKFNQKMVSWVLEECLNRPLNIFIMDFYDETNFVDSVVYLNQAKGVIERCSQLTWSTVQMRC